jgi:hypothetical protein
LSGFSCVPITLTFTYGPSDANIAAGTQLAIQQAADQTALSVATLKQQSSDTQFGDYLTYLTTHDANTLQEQLAAIDAASNVANNKTNTQGAVYSQQISNSSGQAMTSVGAADQYVTSLYMQYLGRAPENSAAENTWVAQLLTGSQSAAQLQNDFINSPEAKNYAASGQALVPGSAQALADAKAWGF